MLVRDSIEKVGLHVTQEQGVQFLEDGAGFAVADDIAIDAHDGEDGATAETEGFFCREELGEGDVLVFDARDDSWWL